jgi:hypothetical protein
VITVRMSAADLTDLVPATGTIGAGTPPNVAPHTLHAHRLWISLWMSLGNQRENSGQPGGNAGVTGSGRARLHSATPAAPRLATVAVHENSRSCLRECRLSPGSTVPMTTTSLYFQRDTHCKKAPRRTVFGSTVLCRTADAAITTSEQEGTGEDRPRA